MKRINIAIDGYSGCGKSTLAKDLAGALNYTFIDSGAMFRGLTHYCIRHGIDMYDAGAIAELIQNRPSIVFDSKSNHLLLNGIDVETQIRNDQKVVSSVSFVAAVPHVRTYLKELQQEYIANKGVVMDGRDIGTVIMPDAELKVFVTATIEERVFRRLQQLKGQGESVTEEEEKTNLVERDRADANRSAAPLKKALNSVCFDTTNFTRESQLEAILSIARPKIDPEKYLPFIQ